MTALAMIIGMIPMAIGLGEGGEQNAPLGRAVIGGLLFATLATLFFVPCVFSIIHGYLARPQATSGYFADGDAMKSNFATASECLRFCPTGKKSCHNRARDAFPYLRFSLARLGSIPVGKASPLFWSMPS